MTIEEKVIEVINDYVSSNGTASKMTSDQLYSLVTAGTMSRKRTPKIDKF